MERIKHFVKNYWAHLIVFLLFTITFFFQVYYNLNGIDQFSWLTFLHGDITFQVERLLIYAHYPGIEPIASTPVDYGAELFWLIPLFKFINLILGTSSINAYYTIVLFHLFMGLAAIYFIASDLTPFEKILFFVTLFTSPYFMAYLGFIKPDPSVVLLCTVLAMYFACKIEFGFKNWVYACIFIALGFGTKWWSIFVLPFLVYQGLFYVEKYKANILRAFKICTTALIILYTVAMLRLWRDFIVLALKYYPSVASFCLEYEIILKSALILSATVLLLTELKLAQYSSNKMTRNWSIFTSLLFSLHVIGVTFLVYEMPFIFSGFFIKSYLGWLIISDMAQISSSSHSYLGNILKWLHDMSEVHYILPLIPGILLLLILTKFKEFLKSDKKLKIYLIYNFIFFTFVFLILKRNNLTMLSMMIPLWLYVFIRFWHNFFKFRFNKALLVVLILAQIGFQNMGKMGDFASFYSSRKDFKDRVMELNGNLRKIFGSNNHFFLCDRGLPYDQNLFDVTFIGIPQCREKILEIVKDPSKKPLIVAKGFIDQFEKNPEIYTYKYKKLDVLGAHFLIYY